ncbi:hypothetical protein BD779DRAFT_850470 [Infundibulicybe gibba]|nr:hypothetical protein BD779DRAFT_850470 [Infundibulicybe gibba]
MSYHATDNLRCYLREAVLPAMLLDPAAPQLPPPGHKSHHNILSVRPESWRRLENMFSVREASIDQMITAWIDTHIPEESLGDEDTDCITGEMFTIPCPPLFDVPIHHERRPTDIRRLSPWIDNLPLMTVQRALHLVFPQTSGWGFHLDGAEDKDRSIFQYFTWRPQDSEKTTPELLSTNGISSRRPVVIAFQPPWILSERDMKEFSESRSFPPFCMPGNAFPSLLESSDRLWAKLWDLCVSKNSSWFVLTSYNHWSDYHRVFDVLDCFRHAITRMLPAAKAILVIRPQRSQNRTGTEKARMLRPRLGYIARCLPRSQMQAFHV